MLFLTMSIQQICKREVYKRLCYLFIYLFILLHCMLYFTTALHWEPPVFKLVPSVWTQLIKQNIKPGDVRADTGRRRRRWKAAMCPAKGMWEPRKLLTRGARLSPLSAENTEGAVFNSRTLPAWKEEEEGGGSDATSSHMALSLFSATFVCPFADRPRHPALWCLKEPATSGARGASVCLASGVCRNGLLWAGVILAH